MNFFSLQRQLLDIKTTIGGDWGPLEGSWKELFLFGGASLAFWIEPCGSWSSLAPVTVSERQQRHTIPVGLNSTMGSVRGREVQWSPTPAGLWGGPSMCPRVTHPFAVWPWATCLTSLSLNFFLLRTRLMIDAWKELPRVDVRGFVQCRVK